MFTVRCREAEQMMLCCDCLGWFPMRKIDEELWELKLELPAGRHHLRYYLRQGQVTIWHSQAELEVSADETTKGSNDQEASE
ncbi:MAG: hypothetical protein WD118_07725 [Phycisphaeraceae bacterium]